MKGFSEEVVSSFNRLVYEYLVKMEFEKSAAAFKSESGLDDVRMGDASPALLNWYSIFVETAEVRSGKTHVPESLSRIEGIMLKLENDKQRYARMSAMGQQYRGSSAAPGYFDACEKPPVHDAPGNSNEAPFGLEKPENGHETPFGPGKSGGYEKLVGFDKLNNYDKPIGFDQPAGYERAGGYDLRFPYPPGFFSQKMPGYQAPGHAQLKEYQRIELSIPFIIIARYCPVSKLVVSCCVDGKVYFYSLPQNTIKYSFQLPRRQVKQMKFTEQHEGLFFMFSFDETAVHLYRYANGKKEDIKTIESDTPVRSYCFGNGSVFVLTESSTLRIHSLGGELLKTFKVSSAVSAIEFFGCNLLFVESSRVVEFDISINMEIKTLGRGKHPVVCVKEDFAFIIFSDSIQVFSVKSQSPIITLKSTLDCRDIAFVFNRVAVCTGDDVYCGSDVLKAPNSISIFGFALPHVSGLMTITADGLLLLFTGNATNEYI